MGDGESGVVATIMKTKDVGNNNGKNSIRDRNNKNMDSGYILQGEVRNRNSNEDV